MISKMVCLYNLANFYTDNISASGSGLKPMSILTHSMGSAEHAGLDRCPPALQLTAGPRALLKDGKCLQAILKITDLPT